MSVTEVKGVKPFPANFPEEPLSEEDKLIQGAIDVYKTKGWTRGWGDQNQVCILNAVNVARTGRPGHGYRGIPTEVIERIHRVVWPKQDTSTMSRSSMAHSVMAWNDSRSENTKRRIVNVLKKALVSRREK